MTHLSVVKTAGRQQFIGLYSNLLGSKSREGREGQGLERDPVFRDLLEKMSRIEKTDTLSNRGGAGPKIGQIYSLLFELGLYYAFAHSQGTCHSLSVTLIG